MLIGRGVDQSVDANLTRKMEGGGMLGFDEVKAVARDAIVREWESGDVALTDTQRYTGARKVRDSAIDDTVNLATHHRKVVAPHIQPRAVQRYWRVDLENFPFDLVGRIDIEETDGVIRDTKTSAKSPSEHEADNSEQLTMYALAADVIDEKLPPYLALDYLVRLKNGAKYVKRETTRREEDFSVLFRRIERAADAIQKEVFLPANQTDWWCSETFCGYASSCPYFRGHHRPTT